MTAKFEGKNYTWQFEDMVRTINEAGTEAELADSLQVFKDGLSDLLARQQADEAVRSDLLARLQVLETIAIAQNLFPVVIPARVDRAGRPLPVKQVRSGNKQETK